MLVDDLLPWQKTFWQRISQTMQQDRLPHAVLLSGREGVGKLHFTRVLAAYLLCDLADPTYQEKNRNLFNSADGHPDMCVLAPEGKMGSIKIDRIRALTHLLSKTPQQGGYRVVIINHADAMNHASANALLKTLEEPGEKVCIILLSNATYRLLSTIKSRCQKYEMSVDACEGQAWLKAQFPDIDTALLWQLCGHAPLNAQNMVADKWLTQRKTLLDGLLHTKDPIAIAAALYQDADNYRVLNCLTTLVTDIIKCQILAMTECINRDYQDNITALANTVPQSLLMDLYDYYCHAKLELDQQVSLQQPLLFENWLIQWYKVTGEVVASQSITVE